MKVVAIITTIFDLLVALWFFISAFTDPTFGVFPPQATEQHASLGLLFGIAAFIVLNLITAIHALDKDD